jgi:transposase
LGLGYRKARGVPAKADPATQAGFLDDTLRPLLTQAEAGTRRVLFADAAHFVRGGFLAYLWCLIRWVVPTGSGRQRYSVLGALDAVTRALVRETTDGTVTEVTAGRLLLTVRAAYPTGPITVVWDNARYQHTALVRVVAAFACIDLVYLPPYPPNLNLIERVWKFVKKTALANRSFADYPAFKAAIDATLDGLGTTHKDAMATLLTLRFETLQKASNSTA